mgnify:CR=1 FL=1
MTDDVSKRASRVLMRHDRNGFRFGCDAYHSFAQLDRPSWWTPAHDARYDDVLGVYENYDKSERESLVFRVDRVNVLGESGFELRYEDIRSISGISKDPISDHIEITLASGRTVDLPCRRGNFDISAILKFLYGFLAK